MSPAVCSATLTGQQPASSGRLWHVDGQPAAAAAEGSGSSPSPTPPGPLRLSGRRLAWHQTAALLRKHWLLQVRGVHSGHAPVPARRARQACLPHVHPPAA